MIAKFMRRRDGPISFSIRVRLLEDVHFAAHLFDPLRMPSDASPFYHRLRSHFISYCASSGPHGRTDPEMPAKLIRQYTSLRENWRRMRADDARVFADFRDLPIMAWMTYGKKEMYPELFECAVRTLSISPSSCAAERSFSMQERIRTKSRNRLHSEKVKKLAFAHWNMRLRAEQGLDAADMYRSAHDSAELEELDAFRSEDEKEEEEDVSDRREGSGGVRGELESTEDGLACQAAPSLGSHVTSPRSH